MFQVTPLYPICTYVCVLHVRIGVVSQLKVADRPITQLGVQGMKTGRGTVCACVSVCLHVCLFECVYAYVCTCVNVWVFSLYKPLTSLKCMRYTIVPTYVCKHCTHNIMYVHMYCTVYTHNIKHVHTYICTYVCMYI